MCSGSVGGVGGVSGVLRRGDRPVWLWIGLVFGVARLGGGAGGSRSAVVVPGSGRWERVDGVEGGLEGVGVAEAFG